MGPSTLVEALEKDKALIAEENRNNNSTYSQKVCLLRGKVMQVVAAYICVQEEALAWWGSL
jgi:septum formation topological specificity factor MinE